jgi:hypothetical protein
MIIVFSILFTNCSTTAFLYPVEGPLSQPPSYVLPAKVNGILGSSGTITMKLKDGEYCEGRWSSAAGAGVSVGTGSLIGQYGAVYGFNTSISTGRGQNPGQAMLMCTRGRTIQVEFITGAGTASGFGIAKDNRGNIFKVIF